MIKTSDVKAYLETQFPTVKFYTGALNKKGIKCVGVYHRGTAPSRMTVGGIQNSTYDILPVTILVHWTENADACETQANLIYAHLQSLSRVTMNSKKVVNVVLLDSCPVGVDRDSDNVVEMVIRVHIYYER